MHLAITTDATGMTVADFSQLGKDDGERCRQQYNGSPTFFVAARYAIDAAMRLMASAEDEKAAAWNSAFHQRLHFCFYDVRGGYRSF